MANPKDSDRSFSFRNIRVSLTGMPWSSKATPARSKPPSSGSKAAPSSSERTHNKRVRFDPEPVSSERKSSTSRARSSSPKAALSRSEPTYTRIRFASEPVSRSSLRPVFASSSSEGGKGTPSSKSSSSKSHPSGSGPASSGNKSTPSGDKHHPYSGNGSKLHTYSDSRSKYRSYSGYEAQIATSSKTTMILVSQGNGGMFLCGGSRQPGPDMAIGTTGVTCSVGVYLEFGAKGQCFCADINAWNPEDLTMMTVSEASRKDIRDHIAAKIRDTAMSNGCRRGDVTFGFITTICAEGPAAGIIAGVEKYLGRSIHVHRQRSGFVVHPFAVPPKLRLLRYDEKRHDELPSHYMPFVANLKSLEWDYTVGQGWHAS